MVGLTAAAMVAGSRRVEAVVTAPVAAGTGGAVVAHVLLAAVVWLMVATGHPDGDDAPARATSVSLVSLPAIDAEASPPAPPPTPPDGTARHVAGDAGYARLGEGEYLGASGELFDYVGDDGLTIEAWYYFEDDPAARERWPLFWKEGSYKLEYWGANRYPNTRKMPGAQGAGWDHRPSLVHGLAGGESLGNRGGRLPLGRWVHVGLQYAHGEAAARLLQESGGMGSTTAVVSHGALPEGGGAGSFTVDHASGPIRDGRWRPHVSGHRGDSPGKGRPARQRSQSHLARADTPLVIGAAPLMLASSAPPPRNRPIGPIRGRLGEVRVSSKARYGGSNSAADGAPPLVPGRFEVDEYTIALWHFDEGPGAAEYSDATGYGHTLHVRTYSE